MLSILLILPACATPLTSAAGNGNVERTKQLLEHGANPNEYDGGGVTPLAQAAYAGHYAIVRELLSHGANPKLADPHDTDARSIQHRIYVLEEDVKTRQ
jgi:ankyrin repeat protein